MKAIGATVLFLVGAYVVDNEFSQGKFTAAAQRMVMQMRHSAGF